MLNLKEQTVFNDSLVVQNTQLAMCFKRVQHYLYLKIFLLDAVGKTSCKNGFLPF